MRKIELKDGKVKNYIFKEQNICCCTTNSFHRKTDGYKVYDGVCNKYNKDNDADVNLSEWIYKTPMNILIQQLKSINISSDNNFHIDTIWELINRTDKNKTSNYKSKHNIRLIQKIADVIEDKNFINVKEMCDYIIYINSLLKGVREKDISKKYILIEECIGSEPYINNCSNVDIRDVFDYNIIPSDELENYDYTIINIISESDSEDELLEHLKEIKSIAV